jgi:hypothetical protein
MQITASILSKSCHCVILRAMLALLPTHVIYVLVNVPTTTTVQDHSHVLHMPLAETCPCVLVRAHSELVTVTLNRMPLLPTLLEVTIVPMPNPVICATGTVIIILTVDLDWSAIKEMEMQDLMADGVPWTMPVVGGITVSLSQIQL